MVFFFFSSSFSSFDPVAASALNIGPKASNDLVVSTSFAHIPANKHVVLGADAASQWGWDNEFPRVTKPVDAFAIRKTPITNAEFVPFIAAGGYSRREFWTDEDWDWIQREKITHPVHWIPNAESKSVCQQLDLRVIGKRSEWITKVFSSVFNFLFSSVGRCCFGLACSGLLCRGLCLVQMES